jgi:hypothetical protein
MGDNLVSSRNVFAPTLLAACALAIGFLGVTPVAATDINRPRYVKPGKFVKAPDGIRYRRYRDNRGVRIHLPVGAASVYCEYPYLYSRGHYPTHIGGYVYYPYHYQRTC